MTQSARTSETDWIIADLAKTEVGRATSPLSEQMAPSGLPPPTVKLIGVDVLDQLTYKYRL